MASKAWTALICSAAIVQGVYAREVPFDFTHCYSGTFKYVSQSEDAEIDGWELTGILRSHADAKLFDNATSHCMGVGKRIGSEPYSFIGYCKLRSPEGNYIVYEQHRLPTSTTWNWKVVASGGKWQGAKGEGASARVTKAKGIHEGTFQQCNRHEGTLAIPE